MLMKRHCFLDKMPRRARSTIGRRTAQAQIVARSRVETDSYQHSSTINQETTYRSDIRLAQKFTNDIVSLNYTSCTNCHRLELIKQTNNHMCAPCKRNPLKFTWSNNMKPGIVPEQLSNLTKIEQLLIAKSTPVMSIYQTKAFGQPGQYHYKGNIINIPQDLNDIVRTLPRTPSTVGLLIVQRQGVNGLSDFRVRRQKILDALIYLKIHHKHYADVEIDVSALSQLPQDGNVADQVPFLQEGGSSTENIDGTEITETVVPSEIRGRHEDRAEQSINWPKQIATPLNEFSAEGYVTMTFLHLFPDGCAGYLDLSRQIKVGFREWDEFLLRYEDKRFAQNARFRFFCLNTAQRKKVKELKVIETLMNFFIL